MTYFKNHGCWSCVFKTKVSVFTLYLLPSTKSQPFAETGRFHSFLKSMYQEIPPLLCKVIIYELNPLLLITIFNLISYSLVSPSVVSSPNCCYQSVLILKIIFQILFLFCPHSVSRDS